MESKVKTGEIAMKKEMRNKAGRGERSVKTRKRGAAPEPAVKSPPAGEKKILMASSEAAPFISTGGMGQVVGAIPKALASADEQIEMRVVVPLYKEIRQRYHTILQFVGETRIQYAWRDQYCGVYSARAGDISYYFVDNEMYFGRDECYGYFDDGERFAFFSQAVFAVIGLTGFLPDIIHANDWPTALVPVYLKTRMAERFGRIKSVFTIHNIEYQGRYPLALLGDIFDLKEGDRGLVEFDGQINLMKGALVCADQVTTVSPTYGEEIRQSSGFGLEPVIREIQHKFTGVLNGIDTSLYDPATDPSLVMNYTVDTVENKAANKLDLQSMFGLTKAPRKMLICVVSRLVRHKGIGILMYMMEDLLKMDVQFLLLGTGDHAYELFFQEMAVRHPGQMGVNIAYNPEIANKIYAGADIMLMPSETEPCGLAQMIACRYGTIPVARATGGLKDTIRDCRGGRGNGFLFTEYNASLLLETISQALDLYTYQENDWQNLIREAMRSDFSWVTSVKKYAEIYKKLSS